MRFLDIITVSFLNLFKRFNNWINLAPFLQQNRMDLFDFGPSVEIVGIEAYVRMQEFPVDVFKTFLSDVSMRSPKRGTLHLNIFGTPGVLREVFLAQVHAFYNAIQPTKLFQCIKIQADSLEISQLADRVKQGKILEVARQKKNLQLLGRFQTTHPKMNNLMLEVNFAFNSMEINLIYKK